MKDWHWSVVQIALGVAWFALLIWLLQDAPHLFGGLCTSCSRADLGLIAYAVAVAALVIPSVLLIVLLGIRHQRRRKRLLDQEFRE